MKIHPISLHVIRQSFLLMDFPQPITIRRVHDVTFPSGTIVTAYHADWTFIDVADYLLARDRFDGEWPRVFLEDCRDCFADDIFPTEYDLPRDTDLVRLTICTRFVGHEVSKQ